MSNVQAVLDAWRARYPDALFDDIYATQPRFREEYDRASHQDFRARRSEWPADVRALYAQVLTIRRAERHAVDRIEQYKEDQERATGQWLTVKPELRHRTNVPQAVWDTYDAMKAELASLRDALYNAERAWRNASR